jgi:hypothetical protein
VKGGDDQQCDLGEAPLHGHLRGSWQAHRKYYAR